MSLSYSDKKRLLKAIEEDREFRYALMGLLGFREILDRISRIEERQQKLEERFAELEERFARLEERQQRLEEEFKKLYERQLALEERFAKLEERQQKLEERFAQLEERFIKLEERVAKLEERVAKLEERFIELEEIVAKLEERFAQLEERFLRVEEAVAGLQRTLATVAHRFGVMSESAFREALKGILEKYFEATAYRWTAYDSEGLVYGHPSEVELDVVIRDKTHILVEVKSRVDPADVAELVRIAQLYERKEGVKPRLAIVAGFVSPRAKKLAESLGIEVYTYIES